MTPPTPPASGTPTSPGSDPMPCPFCGGEIIDCPPDAKYAVCGQCGGTGPVKGTRERAVEAWNRRVESAEAETLRRERDALEFVACSAAVALDYMTNRDCRRPVCFKTAEAVEEFRRIGGSPAPGVVAIVRRVAGLDAPVPAPDPGGPTPSDAPRLKPGACS